MLMRSSRRCLLDISVDRSATGNLAITVMRKRWPLVVTLCSIPVLIVIFFKTHEINSIIREEERSEANIDCSMMLQAIDPPLPALLIDTHVLQSLEQDRCQYIKQRIRLAIDVELPKSLRKDGINEYDIIQYETPPDTNYLRFHDIVVRIIPQIQFDVVGNLSIPNEINRFFEIWKRSKFVECLALDMNRTSEEPYLPKDKTIQTMSSFTQYLMSFDVYPFLNGGTLLGR
ncbi:hypothetical protein OSTOST_03818 [Ostertagia ostertagi]